MAAPRRDRAHATVPWASVRVRELQACQMTVLRRAKARLFPRASILVSHPETAQMATSRRNLAHTRMLATAAALQHALEERRVADGCRIVDRELQVRCEIRRLCTMPLGGKIREGSEVARLDQALEMLALSQHKAHMACQHGVARYLLAAEGARIRSVRCHLEFVKLLHPIR